jgi:hypothetical protein
MPVLSKVERPTAAIPHSADTPFNAFVNSRGTMNFMNFARGIAAAGLACARGTANLANFRRSLEETHA